MGEGRRSVRAPLACRSGRGAGGEGMTSRTRVGFVGAGIIAERHLRDLLAFEDVAVAALADPRGQRARDLAERCDAHVYPDHAAMLAEEDLDAVYVCVPP